MSNRNILFPGLFAAALSLFAFASVSARSTTRYLTPRRLAAQSRSMPQRTRVRVPRVPPLSQDVATIDGIMKAYYEDVSGPAAHPQLWASKMARDRTLFIPGARLVATYVGKDGLPHHKVLTLEQSDASFLSSVKKKGHYEREIHRVTTRFGTIAHVLSTSAARRTPDGPVYGHGVNSVDLFFDGQRWWIVSALWDIGRKGNPIPKNLLPQPGKHLKGRHSAVKAGSASVNRRK